MSYIYQITNLINKKIYVGYTSRNINIRFQEHWNNRFNDNSLIHKAMIKYGKENFEIKVLESFNEEDDSWVSKEQYWIEKLHSQTPNGYNICDGGNKPPVHYGEKNNKSKLSVFQYNELIYDLQHYDLDFGQIASKYQISQSQVERINKGEIRHNDKLSYPLRKLKRDRYIIQQIIKDLKENILSQSEIEEKYQIKSRTRLYNINTGKVGKKYFPQESYPIRKNIQNRIPTYLLK